MNQDIKRVATARRFVGKSHLWLSILMSETSENYPETVVAAVISAPN